MNRAGEGYEKAVAAAHRDLGDVVCWSVVAVSTTYLALRCWLPFIARVVSR